ncbi:MAG TPA: response regulator transcription factor [Nitrospirota bacterium]|nr:response regulator transcription factor [Nitrospirota bacterium]
MIRMIIVDDHPIFREGLKKIISESHDIVIEDEVSTGMELLSRIKKNSYDIIILDISLPDMSGLEILGILQNEKKRPPVLIISMHPEEQYAVRALKTGASGYLTKGSIPDELLTAIRRVSAGRKYISSALAEKLAADLNKNDEQPAHDKLSDREYQVMVMLASGKTTGEVARQLLLSLPTISTYRSRILHKINLKNNAELIHYAIKHNLV